MLSDGITVGVKTFLRPDKLKTCLQHVHRLETDPDRVLVADDSPAQDINRDVYDHFEGKLPLEVIRLEPDVGLSAGRNRIVDETETTYLLMIDDDHYVPSGMLSMRRILEEDPSLGGVSSALVEDGNVRLIAGDIRLVDGWVIIDVFEDKPRHRVRAFDYYKYDFVPNSTLFRTRALRDYSWDEAYRIDGEHEDFFLGHKWHTEWEFAITPDSVVEHDPGPGLVTEYADHRNGEEKRSRSRAHFVDKWGVKGYLFRGYHDKEYAGPVAELASKAMFSLPSRVQWELKQHGYLDRLKRAVE